MTASNGPATADKRSAQRDRHWARRPRSTARASARDEAQVSPRCARKCSDGEMRRRKIPKFRAAPGLGAAGLELPASRRRPRFRSAPARSAHAAGQGPSGLVSLTASISMLCR
jgi:hypothetical protein